MKMGQIGYPETSVRNHHYLLRNSPEERNSHLLLGKSVIAFNIIYKFEGVLTGRQKCDSRSVPLNSSRSQDIVPFIR